MSYFEVAQIKTADSPSADAFGRFRVSNPSTIIDSKQLHDKQPLIWSEVVNGTATSVHSTTTNSTTMTVNANGDYVIRQTRQRANYQPGKSPLIEFTFTMGAQVANTQTKIGYFNTSTSAPYTANEDGIYFEDTGSAYQIVLANNGSTTAIDSASWTIPDGLTIDWTKSQIGWIDYQYLGVGRVRVGINIDGQAICLHEFKNANNHAGVYMSSPNHSIRYEIRSTGGVSSLEHICSTVISEGGEDLTGIKRSSYVNPSSPIQASSSANIYAIKGIRLKSANIDATIDILETSISSLSATNGVWMLLFNPTVAGTFTYSDETDSSVQVATGSSTNTVTGGYLVDSGAFSSVTRSASQAITNALRLGSEIDGTMDEYVLAVKCTGTNINFIGTLSWYEAL